MLVKAKQKNRALLILKLKKHKTDEADNIDKQLYSVHEMIDNIEWASVNMKVVFLSYYFSTDCGFYLL